MAIFGVIEKNSKTSALPLVSCLVLTFALTLHCQSAIDLKVGDSKVKRIGTAEVRLIERGSLFDPEHQREVYWHDPDWKIDLVIPSSKDKAYKVSIRSNSGTASTIELPGNYEQINQILRSPGAKAIVEEEDGEALGDFSVIDLKEGKLIAHVPVAFTEISPDRRFVFFQRWVARFARDNDENENLFAVYDLLKSPQENVCAYDRKDPRHEHLELALQGFQVYPQKPGQTDCTVPDDFTDDNEALKFSWAADSSKIVFADVKSGVMSLVLVTMPVGTKDLPKTSIYTLKGAEDVCAGATDAAGEKNCDYHVIQSVGWEGDAIKVVFHHQFGTKLDLEKTIPLSKFVPVGK